MVRLPTLGGRQVRPAPVPGVRVPTNVPVAAYGMGTALGVREVGYAAADVAIDEARKKRQVDVTAAIAQAETYKTELLYGKNGYAKLKGQDRMARSQGVQQDYGAAVAQVRGGLDADAQAMFDATYGIESSMRFGREVGQMHLDAVEDYEEGVRTNARAGLLNDAYAMTANGTMTPQSSDELLGKLVAVEMAYADRTGQDPRAAGRAAVSDFHETQLEAMLASHKDVAAVAYFERHKNGMLAEQRHRMQQKVYTTAKDGLAEASAAAIVKAATGQPGTRAEQEFYARTLLEEVPDELRGEVSGKVDEEFADLNRLDSARVTDAFKKLDELAASGESPSDLRRRKEWEVLDQQHRDAIDSRVERQTSGEAAVSDPDLYDTLTIQSENPKAWGDFMRQPIERYNAEGRLSSDAVRHFTELKKGIAAALGGQRGEAWRGVISTNERVSQVARELHGENVTARGAFEMQANEALMAFSASTGKEPSLKETEAVLNAMVSEAVPASDNRYPGIPDWIGSMFSDADRLMDVVPPAEIGAIVDYLRRRGVEQPSAVQVQATWDLFKMSGAIR